jgi:hypothetical protein
LVTADAQLRDAATHVDDGAARVLVAEITTITRSLAAIAADSHDIATP